MTMPMHAMRFNGLDNLPIANESSVSSLICVFVVFVYRINVVGHNIFHKKPVYTTSALSALHFLFCSNSFDSFVQSGKVKDAI